MFSSAIKRFRYDDETLVAKVDEPLIDWHLGHCEAALKRLLSFQRLLANRRKKNGT
jgi:hypothetical protein